MNLLVIKIKWLFWSWRLNEWIRLPWYLLDNNAGCLAAASIRGWWMGCSGWWSVAYMVTGDRTVWWISSATNIEAVIIVYITRWGVNEGAIATSQAMMTEGRGYNWCQTDTVHVQKQCIIWKSCKSLSICIIKNATKKQKWFRDGPVIRENKQRKRCISADI